MRRKDREIVDLNEITEIIKKCDVCRIAFFDEEYPYIIPMNFGFTKTDNDIELFFHCAKIGKKLDLLKSNPKVGFEMDCSHHLILGENDCNSTMEFESVCGNGIAKFLPNDQKITALSNLMRQYSPKGSFEFAEAELNCIEVFKIKVSQIVGKRLKRNE